MINLEAITPHELWNIAVRKRWMIIATVLATSLSAWVISQMLPKSYRSNTLILVENQKIPEAYVSAVVGGTISERLTIIKQQVLSRTVLSRVINEFHLAPADKSDEISKELLLEALRKNILIETKGAPGSSRIDAFSISFAHENPATAMAVTANLATQFIEENLRSREQLVEGTTEFLDQELQRAKASLEEQERAIANFKRKNMGELPGQLEANLQTLNRLQRDLVAVNETIQSRTDRRAAIQKMINAYEVMGLSFLENPRDTVASSVGDNRAQARVPVETARATGSGGDPLSARLRELERQLMTLSAEYRDTYPDIIQTKQEIAQVKARIAERQGLAEKEPKEEANSSRPQLTEKKPVVIGVPTPVDPYLHELKRERDENDVGLSGLKEQQRRLTEQIREYQMRVEHTPEREQELIVLQRDYENTKKNYQTLLDKQLNARVSENLEKRQKAEKFRVLDPANLPTRPESPDVLKIMLAGLVLGCGLGYGTALGLELMAGVIRRPEEAESLLGLPVLASIPHFRLVFDQKRSSPYLPGPSSYPTSDPSKSGTSMVQSRKTQPQAEEKVPRMSWRQTNQRKDSYAFKMSGTSDSTMLMHNLVARWQPDSVVAEQYRVAATRLVLAASNQPNNVIVVTSSVTGEGKSSTSSNLAYVLARDLGKKTLVVDCDFKRPTLHAYVGVPSKPGLAEAIYGDAPLEACLHRYDDTSMWVLPSGRRDHRLVDLTKIPQLNSILNGLKPQFDFIILDAPPILPLADMNLLASMADMILLVIRAGVTSHELVQKGIKTLKPTGRAGVILTGYDQDAPIYALDYYHGGRGSYKK